MVKIKAWVWLAIIALVPRLINLGGESLWYDESFTAWVAKLPLQRLLPAIQGDVHPPLFYLIEWLNIRIFGTSEAALRLPSLVFGVIAVLLVWRVALAAGLDRRTAFVAGVLAALLPVNLYYSQEARMYTLLSVFVLLATLGVLQRNYLLLILGCLGAIYSQNLGAFYVASLGTFVAFQAHRERRLVGPLYAAGLIFLGAIPWAAWVTIQARSMGAGFWLQSLTASGAIIPVAQMTLGWRIADSLQIPVYGAAFTTSIVGAIAAWKWFRSRPGSIVLIAILGAPVLVAIVSVLWRSIYLPRAFLPSALLLMIIWSWALNQLLPGGNQAMRTMLVPALVIGMVSHYFPATSGRMDLVSWTAPVNAEWRPGDVVFYTAIHAAVNFEYYIGKPYRLREYASDLNQSLSEATKAEMDFSQGNFDDLARDGFRRAWLMIYRNPMSSIAETTEIARILATYPHKLIARKAATNAEMSIYLVQL